MNYKQQIFDSLLEDLQDTYARKNNDYGDSVGDTYRKYGDLSFLVRITDKFNRIETLSNRTDQMVMDESLEDTIKDLANYCLLWLVEKENNKSIKSAQDDCMIASHMMTSEPRTRRALTTEPSEGEGIF